MQNKIVEELVSSTFREKVYIETHEHIIRGYVFMPKLGKQSRLLSDILNTEKKFIAVKNCVLEYKLNTTKSVESHDFLHINMASILIMRPDI